MSSATPVTATSGSEKLWLQSGIFILVLMVPFGAAMLLEERTFNGINVWIKPLKFQISTFIHFFTFYLVAQLMPVADRKKPLFATLVWASVIAALFEIGIITLRAGQAQASHFNFSTQTDAILYALMGVGAVTMVLPAFYLGLRFLRSGDQFDGGIALKTGIGVGFIAGAVLTLIFGSYMSQNGSHFTSGQLSDAGGLPLLGWSSTGGDLRPAHFFATHLLQALPVIGLIAGAILGEQNSASRIPVFLGLLLLGGMSVFAFVQALNGQPFFSA